MNRSVKNPTLKLEVNRAPQLLVEASLSPDEVPMSLVGAAFLIEASTSTIKGPILLIGES
jgi:hypothetical protein